MLNCRLPYLGLWAALWLMLATGVCAQPYKILDVQVKGNVNASISTITTIAAFPVGADLNGTAIQDAVRNLYAKGIFRDIFIDLEQMPAGVVITINVAEYPLMTGLTFKGNKKISTKDLNDKLKLAPGGYISDNLITASRNKIETEYMAKGYYLAEARPQLVYTPDSAKAELVFDIKEYDKVKVEKVVLTGAQQLKADDLIGKMSNRKHGFLRSSDFKREKYPEDKEKIVEYCNKKGHIDAYIKSDSITVDSSRNRITIYVDIFEGPCYYFGQTSFSGNDLISAEKLTKALKFKPGQVFDQGKYDESTGELYSAYQEDGYLHTRVVDERKTRDSTIDIAYQITEGLPSQVKLIDITGNTKTKEKVIRREMMIRPGQTFHRSLFMRSLRDIMQLNYFSDVKPDIRDLPSGDIDLLVKTQEKPTGQVSVGAGYSGQDKLVGTFGLGIPNFRGNGQNASINVDFGSRRNSVTLGFTEPWFMGTPTLIGAEIFDLNRRWYDEYTEGQYGASLRVGRRLRWPDNYCRAYISYRLESVRYYDLSDSYLSTYGYYVYNSGGIKEYFPFSNSLAKYSQKWLKTSALSFTLDRDSRDLPTFATSGSYISYTGEYSGDVLGGHWNFFKHTISANKYYPLKWGTALVGKVKFGYISATSYDNILPSELFTPGGTDPDGTVRGYSDASLSPSRNATDPFSGSAQYSSLTGSMLGGMSEVIYNLTLQMPIMKNQLFFLTFADAGTSWDSKRKIRLFSHLYRGAGFGFRLVVPGVGVIGFDFGYAFDVVSGESRGWRPHFQVGSGD